MRSGKANQRGIAFAEHQQIRARASDKSPVRLTNGSGATRQTSQEQPRGRAGIRRGLGRHIALPKCQALPVFQQPQFFGPASRDVTVGTERQRSAALQPARKIAETIAEVRFSAGTEHDTGASRRHQVDLLPRGMCCVHELPARVEIEFAHQPFDWPQAGRSETVIHLVRLLGDVQMKRCGVARTRVDEFMHRSRRGGA